MTIDVDTLSTEIEKINPSSDWRSYGESACRSRLRLFDSEVGSSTVQLWSESLFAERGGDASVAMCCFSFGCNVFFDATVKTFNYCEICSMSGFFCGWRSGGGALLISCWHFFYGFIYIYEFFLLSLCLVSRRFFAPPPNARN